MASHEMVLGAVESSNLAPREKSSLRKWYDQVSSNGAVARAKHHVTSTAEAFRAGSEGLVIGAIAGVLDSELKHGLDIPTGNEAIPFVPGEGALGTVMLIASAVMGPGDFGATDARNVGGQLVAISSYRKTKEFADMKRAQGKGIVQTVSNAAGEFGRVRGGARIAGEMGGNVSVETDPIINMAKGL